MMMSFSEANITNKQRKKKEENLFKIHNKVI